MRKAPDMPNDKTPQCSSVWVYELNGRQISHRCALEAGHPGAHNSYAAQWSREHERLVPGEHNVTRKEE
jgi:hypothetical protein